MDRNNLVLTRRSRVAAAVLGAVCVVMLAGCVIGPIEFNSKTAQGRWISKAHGSTSVLVVRGDGSFELTDVPSKMFDGSVRPGDTVHGSWTIDSGFGPPARLQLTYRPPGKTVKHILDLIPRTANTLVYYDADPDDSNGKAYLREG